MPIQTIDHDLLEKIANGDKKIFEEIHLTYYPEIRRFIYFRVGLNEQLAEDLASAVFLQFFEYISRGNAVDHVRGFLYRSTKNHLSNYFRETHEIVDINDPVAHETSDEFDLEEFVDIKMDTETALSILPEIKAELRDVIIMRYLKDLEYEEIARICEKTVENVRVMVNRGLKEIRKRLTERKRVSK